jgi:hypothetical protein
MGDSATVAPVADDKGEVTDADGPLIRAALNRAKEVDEAPTAGQRRRRWLPLLGTTAAAFAEKFLRDTLAWGAVLFSLLAIAFGVASGHVAWAIGMAVSGVAGVVLVFWAIAKRWAFRRQWAVLLGVLLVQIVLIVLQQRTN